jgi:phenolic acid decarboxylase
MAHQTFIQVGELAKRIAQGELPPVRMLAGTSFALHCEDGSVIALRFRDQHVLDWEVLSGFDAGRRSTQSCFAFNPRDRLYLVDWLDSSRRATSISLVFDLDAGSATMVVGTLPREAEVQRGLYALASEGAELTGVRAEFLGAAIDRPFDPEAHLHRPTTEMIGKRVQYVYSPSEVYEHIYLNEKLYAWQCLAGVEQGLADVDRCHALKLGDQLYLFVWREKIVPTLGVVVIDWRQHRSAGKLFGYESNDFDKLVNTPIAAASMLLNVTTHPGIDS